MSMIQAGSREFAGYVLQHWSGAWVDSAGFGQPTGSGPIEQRAWGHWSAFLRRIRKAYPKWRFRVVERRRWTVTVDVSVEERRAKATR